MLELAERAAREAGRIMREGRAQVVQHKGAVNLVTEIDLACETAVREILEAGAPGIPVLGEEEGGAEGVTTRWIVDPLDGTTNYVHGYPSYACLIALQDRGALEVGVTYDPVRDHCYRARRGHGADLDGQPLRVTPTADLDRALLASGFPYDRRERADEYLAYVKAFILRAQGFRRAGAAGMDLAWLASGRVDGFWEFNLQPWDVAAGTLLVQEAGGVVTDMDGGPLDLDRPRILASNGHLHEAMLEVIGALL
jgi:myo-inositol-1(or 4)-monophosphatase